MARRDSAQGLCAKPVAELSVRNPGGIDRIGQRKRRLGINRRFLCSRLADVDPALEKRSVLDRDPLRDHVAGQSAVGANVNPVGGVDVALHFAEHHHFPRRDVGLHLAVPANRHPVAVERDRALDFAVDVSDSEPVSSPLMIRLLPIVA